VLNTSDQFRAPVPPALTDPAYTVAYNEVKNIGGDAIVTPSIRTPDQTVAGIYWAYDGTPSLCAPPRLYNQIALLIGTMHNLQEIELARLLALTNVAMADAALAIWESKFFYQLWRPIAAIRESDPGTGPTGLGDGNAGTLGDGAWTPLGAPGSNALGPNFTPPFPSYPSGHAGFGGAMFQVLRRFFGTDNIPFTFVSDEFNGVTTGNNGLVRPLIPRSFTNLSQAEEENGQSRIYLGIHWSYDKTEGILQGNLVGDWTFDNSFQPLP
jgi:membrane-associated phospholipid phosphatase